ncbi:hypothetical protein BDB01DRAFT_852970 [Pilobolus umbonatus]|nr:hypothetical protein BDB01DRAFT_852970 [Pilobolus umbonatus]
MSYTQEYFDDPSDFDKEPFRNIDNDLRCPICKEIYNIPMILTTCSHSFCTQCIRRCLIDEQLCPKCRKPSYENNLIHNYALEDISKAWKQQRLHILSIENKAKQSLSGEKPADMSSTEITFSYETPGNNDTDFTPSPSLSQPSSQTEIRKSNRIRSCKQRGKEKQTVAESLVNGSLNKKETDITASTIVLCPICEQHMKYAVLDLHLDRCMKGDSSIPASPSSTPSTSSRTFTTNRSQLNRVEGKKPHKLVYSMLTDKALQHKLRDLGLPYEGDRTLNIWRHKEYLTLYNSNNDSTSPVSTRQLINTLADNERVYLRNKSTQSKKKITDAYEHNILFINRYPLCIISHSIHP